MTQLDDNECTPRWKPWYAVNSPASVPLERYAESDREPYDTQAIHTFAPVVWGVGTLQVGGTVARVHGGATLVFVNANSATSGAFRQLVEDKVREATEVVHEWQSAGDVDAHLANRLLELVAMARDDYPETEIPHPEALLSVLRFFRSFRNGQMLEPSVALTSSGSIWIEWSDGPRRAALEFKGDGVVNMAAFYPDPEQPLLPTSFAGIYSWKSVSKEIRNKQGLEWLTGR